MEEVQVREMCIRDSILFLSFIVDFGLAIRSVFFSLSLTACQMCIRDKECGIRLGDFNEYEAGDIIECYTLEKIQQTL